MIPIKISEQHHIRVLATHMYRSYKNIYSLDTRYPFDKNHRKSVVHPQSQLYELFTFRTIKPNNP